MMSLDGLKSSSRQIYSHTGLRGIAAMIVFLGHANGWFNGMINHSAAQFCQSGGHCVDLFFILSGFILNWVYLAPDGGVIDWPSYLKARVARIMPLYYLTLAFCLALEVCVVLRHGVVHVGQDYLIRLIFNVFMLSGIMDGVHWTINGPAWSIGVEFFCYLAIFPILIQLHRYFANKRYGVLANVSLALIFTRLLVLCYRMSPLEIYHWHWDTTWIARGIFGFSIGFLLCSVYRTPSRWKPSNAVINLMVLGSIAVFLLTCIDYMPAHLLLYALPFLVYFTAFDTGVSAYFLKIHPLQWLGERSYSLYLWHQPIIGIFGRINYHLFKGSHPSLLNYPILVVVVLLVSELSYRFIEIPSREYIRKLGSQRLLTPPLAIPSI